MTAERVGLMVQHQVVLMCRKLTRMQSGVNLPLSEVIMSRVHAYRAAAVLPGHAPAGCAGAYRPGGQGGVASGASALSWRAPAPGLVRERCGHGESRGRMAEKKRMTTRRHGTREAARYGCKNRRDASSDVVTKRIGRALHVRLLLENLLRVLLMCNRLRCCHFQPAFLGEHDRRLCPPSAQCESLSAWALIL